VTVGSSSSTSARSEPRRTALDLFRDPTTAPALRAKLLDALVVLRPDGFLRAIAEELEHANLAEDYFDDLAGTVEALVPVAEAERLRLAHALFARVAERLSVNRPAEWSAIRSLSSLLPVADLDRLARFLRPDVPLETRQAAAQAASRALASAPRAETTELVRASRETAAEFAEIPGNPAHDSLLLSVLELSAIAGDEMLPALVERCTSRRDVLFKRQLSVHLHDVARRARLAAPDRADVVGAIANRLVAVA
jgi:hypothetical protein